MIDEAAAPGNQNGQGPQQPGQPANAVSPQLVQTMYAQMNALRRELNELRQLMSTREGETRAYMGRQFSTLNRNIQRVAIAPARPIRAAGDQQQPQQDGNEARANIEIPFASTLSPLPRTLYDLWTEYQYGIGGRKAAKDFTATERGRVKYSYHRRKVVWDVIAGLVRAGHTSNVAIDRIYDVYGRGQSVTNIINRMRRDRAQGGHPNLRV